MNESQDASKRQAVAKIAERFLDELVALGVLPRRCWGVVSLPVRAGQLAGHLKLEQTFKFDSDGSRSGEGKNED